MSRAGSVLSGSLCAWSALLASACSAPTELVVVIDTNLDVPAEMNEVVVSVTGPAGLTVSGSEQLDVAGAPAFPLTLGIRPANDQLGPIDVVVAGQLSGALVVERRVQTTLTEGESKVLHVLLVRSCLDVECPDGESCGRQGCEPALVAGLPTWTGTPPAFDPTDSCYVDPWDPDGDGHGNTACGGDDCDNTEPTVFPGAQEDCDGLDNDCDMDPDPDCGCAPLGVIETCPTTCGSTGMHECMMGTSSAMPSVWSPCAPPVEVCNQADDDCDGGVDELLPMRAAAARMVAAPSYAYVPEVVWAGDRWAVFYTADHDDDGVHLLSLAEDGTPMGAPILVARDGERAGAAWDGTSLALAYTDSDTYCCATDPATGTCTSNCTDYALELSILTPDGARTLDGRQLNDDIDTSQKPMVIWGDGGIALGYCDTRPYVHRLTADGGDRESRASFLSGSECPFGLSLDGSRYAGVVNDGGSLRFAEGMFGLWADTTPLLAGRTADPDTIRLVRTSAGVLVAFTDDATLTVGAIEPTVPTLASMAVVATDVDRSGDADMASRGDGALLVWTADTATGEEDIAFVALDAAGSPTEAATPLHVSPVGSDDPDVAWSGTRFGVAWIENGENVWFTTVACE